MTKDEVKSLVETAKTLSETFNKASNLINPIRPLASDMVFQVSKDSELSGQEVLPGKTMAQVADECGSAVESIANTLAVADGSLSLLASFLSEADD